jgi:hypothetical protein
MLTGSTCDLGDTTADTRAIAGHMSPTDLHGFANV